MTKNKAVFDSRAVDVQRGADSWAATYRSV
jgi:hypothetical protein